MRKNMKEKHVLLVLASGKSSRFGGFPKTFCKVDNSYVAQRTIDLAKSYFESCYLVVNKEIFPGYKDRITGCKTFGIETGQGDSHSFLRAAKLIEKDCGADKITLCWGDTFYLDDVMFRRAAEIGEELDSSSVGISLSSIDKEPYAWYEVEGDVIKQSHFRSKDGIIPEGVHDQSVFVFNLDMICSQLENYMAFLGLNDEDDYINKEVLKEMKLLDSFTYFYENNLIPMKYTLVESGRSYSFNTSEELENIRKQANKGARAVYVQSSDL